MDVKTLARYIDHTLLKPEATIVDIKKLCMEAQNFRFASVCVHPIFVKACKRLISNPEIKICTVIGFPLGASITRVKVFETQTAIQDGAEEIDMVMQIGMLKSKSFQYVEKDINEVVNAAKNKAIVKVILETCLLDQEEKIKACEIAKRAGAHFVKTSTGFNKEGAKTEDVRLMRQVVGDVFGVKAAGGIRDYKKAMEMIRAGANRIGASASVDILKEK